MKLAPIRLEPLFVPRIWGTRNLQPLYAMPAKVTAGVPSGSKSEQRRESDGPDAQERIGEVWLTGNDCVFASGPHAGRTLGEAWPQLPAEWTGGRLRDVARIPLLVKFIFPEDHLSIQVHPDDEYARKHESASGGIGKTEMWYAVTAQPNAEVRLGFEAGVTRESFRRAIAEGRAEQCLRRLAVHPGDSFFVPAGTPHTIGPGMVLCEVQEHSDLTYRVFDYNRVTAEGTPRPLHMRQAFEVLEFGGTPANSGQCIEPVHVQAGPLLKTYLAACRHFAVESWQFSGPVAHSTSPERFELLVIVAGTGQITSASESQDYTAGQCWFLPAALGAFQLTAASSTTLLRTYVPDLQQVERELSSVPIDPAVRGRIIHS